MRVHLIKRQSIEDFVAMNSRHWHSFEDWLEKIRRADWEKPTDIKATFASADLLGKGSNRVVFDIAGNSYRIICKYVFGGQQVHLFVCWVGTHAAYDLLNKKQEQYIIHQY